MSELDEAWALALAEAEQRARAAGRKDIADYLALRNSNDLLRTTGIRWLIDTFVTAAGAANRSGGGIQFTRVDSHRFMVGRSTMVGPLLTLNSGVRTLFVEAGWPRTPRDGFVSGGGLARGNIRHLGIKSADLELLLKQAANGVPEWLAILPDGQRHTVHETIAAEQIRRLLDR